MAAGGLSARCGAAAARAEGTRGQRGGSSGSRCGRTPLRGTGGWEGLAGRGRNAGREVLTAAGRAPGWPRPLLARAVRPRPPGWGTLGDPRPHGAEWGAGILWLFNSVLRDQRLGRTPWLWRGRGLDPHSLRGVPDRISSSLRRRERQARLRLPRGSCGVCHKTHVEMCSGNDSVNPSMITLVRWFPFSRARVLSFIT